MAALIIVESPTKARTFNRILKGADYYVYATMGHIRDLPSSKIAIDYEHDFKPDYKIIKTKDKVVKELKQLAKKYKEVILATDPDREGESISYHVAYLLGHIDENWPDMSFKGNDGLKRIIFHEITPAALEEALAHPQTLRFDLIKAQAARRILDRIVGYELSPLLWKKMGKNWLSAGRVQTVALRLIVEREKEIKKFKLEDYFQIFGLFKDGEQIQAKLTGKGGVAYEQKFSIDLFTGTYTYTKTTIGKENLDSLIADIKNDIFKVEDVKETIQKRFPPAPFTTSTLQQESFHRFGYSSKMTMRLAQDLYEQGLITYHRTDSFNLSEEFTRKTKEYIEKTYGNDYSLSEIRVYKTKSKMAQEAHEAIRPTKLTPTIEIEGKIISGHLKLYKLIFERAVATQMKEAAIKSMKIIILGEKSYRFESDLQKVLFDGFLRVANPEYAAKNQNSSTIKKGEILKLVELTPQASQTKPPPRFNDASLIKTLEEKGIGRPSTYAPIISLIQEKNYVEKENKTFIPTILGNAISDYLSSAFPTIFALDFTANMEGGLDEIAAGHKDFIPLLADFNKPFQTDLKIKKEDKQVIDIEEKVDEKCPKCGSPLMIRFSRFGKFMACSNFPTCRFTKPFLQFVPEKFCPLDKGRIVVRYTKKRKKFFGCENYPKCTYSAWRLS